MANVLHSKLLYAATIWASALSNHAIQKKLFSAQRGEAVKIVSACRTVSTSAMLVPAFQLIGEEKAGDLLAPTGTHLYGQPTGNRSREGSHTQGRRKLVEIWHSRWHGEQTRSWTYRLIPQLATWLDRKPGEVGFYLEQALSDHGCFNAYLKRFKKRDVELCRNCGFPVDDAEYTLFYAFLAGATPRFAERTRQMVSSERMTEESSTT